MCYMRIGISRSTATIISKPPVPTKGHVKHMIATYVYTYIINGHFALSR